MRLAVLITHEKSGVVRDAFRALGCDAWSCDLLPSESGSQEFHIQGDALVAIASRKWDMVGMHPECVYLTVSGMHWNNRGRGWDKTEAAMQHVFDLRDACEGTPYYLENSVGIISSRWRTPDQIIQPYQFGDDASKKTCLWLSSLPRLAIDTKQRKSGRVVEWPRDSGKMVERWSNQTDSGQNKLAPSETRSAERAQTYPGIARAMAKQWSEYLISMKNRDQQHAALISPISAMASMLGCNPLTSGGAS